ncbi:hypothetical protein CLIB1423_03S06106 [[Candida] railenensis]|uniref:PH domain-containing protein n=1 Tax=[Candida] railenensis TaxID=45579 RepID=A0A9P0QN07_9ASCO|nr:hypothetical protein CLIB1423_03S06106 [[Candida] railenensis]
MGDELKFQTLSKDQFKIPSNSFSAFKLSYDDANNISESSKTVLLGKIPDTWFEEKSKGLVNRFVKSSRKSLRSSFKNVIGGVLGSSTSGSSYEIENKVMDILETSLNADPEDDSDFSAESHSDRSDCESERFDQFSYNDPSSLHSEEPLKGDDPSHQHTEIRAAHPSESPDIHFSKNGNKGPVNKHIDEEVDPNDATGIDIYSPAQSPSTFDNSEYQIPLDSSRTSLPSAAYSVTMNSDFDSSKSGAEDVSAQSHVVRFNTQRSNLSRRLSFRRISKSRKNIAVVMPQPCDEPVLSGNQRVRRIHIKEERKVMKKMKRLASRGKKSARKSTGDVKQRLVKKLLRSYQNGEIIKADKMLVLIKIAKSVNQLPSFSENEPCDSRVYERWREYMVVLRKSNRSSTSTEIQLYDVNKKKKSQKLIKPDISFPLTSKQVKVQFYSAVDKSISLIVGDHDPDTEEEEVAKGVKIYILQCQAQSSSYQWLYLMKGVLGYNMPSAFQVAIPMLDLSIFIEIPLEVVKDSFISKNLDSITVNKLSKGYSIEYVGIFKYLREAISSSAKSLINATTSEKIQKAIREAHNFWLCYKYYDRLEWASFDSHMFYIQNLVKTDQYQVELRDKTISPRSTRSISGKLIKEPVPIEGFLSRLTDIFGDEKSILSKFYRMSYFYSSDNILFYTKFYRAIPPSPDSAFLFCDEGTDMYEIASKMPNVFEQNPFPLDENDHIEWFNDENFEKMDKLALSELERRIHQIVKAEAAIDLCQVREIRKVPFKSISLLQKKFMNLIWYSNNQSEDDEEIMDSVLEIEMIHGSVLKLQAPSRLIRDQWISRLQDLKNYWFIRKNDDLAKMSEVRLKNKNNLMINEYTDSNIVKEVGKVELAHSVADSHVYNMDSLSLNRCIIMSGYLYVKPKVHSDFAQYFVVLCPGFLLLFTFSKRSKRTGVSKETSSYEHYMTIGLNSTYLHSGESTAGDLLYTRKEFDSRHPGHHTLPRIYSNGWKSAEEEPIRCFSIWMGKKRNYTGKAKSNYEGLESGNLGNARNTLPKNPGFVRMYQKFGLTGKTILFMARSRQERELWVTNILIETDRYKSIARKR